MTQPVQVQPELDPGARAPAGPGERVAFALAVLALLASHMLVFEQGEHALVLGWMPRDLAYRVAWMLAAAGVVFWMTARLWPNHE